MSGSYSGLIHDDFDARQNPEACRGEVEWEDHEDPPVCENCGVISEDEVRFVKQRRVH